MTDALDEAIDAALQSLAAIDDPIERYRVSRDLRTQIDRGSNALKSAQAQIANELKADRSWREVGERLGVSGSRAEQISRGK
ncbi:hypothetical protein [Streptomyces sp. NPDC002402]